VIGAISAVTAKVTEAFGAGPAKGTKITFCAKSMGVTPLPARQPGGTVTLPDLSLGGLAIPVGTEFYFNPPDAECKSKFEYVGVATACLQVGPGCDATFTDLNFLPCMFDTEINQGGAPRGQTFQVTLANIFPNAKTAEWVPTGSMPQCPSGCYLYYDAGNRGVGACVIGESLGLGGSSATLPLLALALLLAQ
jgi:hypothetical protein